jgi:hypothetical protein
MFFKEGKYYKWVGGKAKCDLDFKDKMKMTDGVPRRVISNKGRSSHDGCESVWFEGLECLCNWHPDNFAEFPGKIVNIEDAPTGAIVRLISLMPGDITALKGQGGVLGKIGARRRTLNGVVVEFFRDNISPYLPDAGAKVELLDEPIGGSLDNSALRESLLAAYDEHAKEYDSIAPKGLSLKRKKKKYEYHFESSHDELRDEVLNMIRLDQ